MRPDEQGTGVTSVDPGEIRAFAQFLDEMTGKIKDEMKSDLDNFAKGHPRVFGYYGDSSERAESKHKTMVSNASEYMSTMYERFSNIALGTHAISKRYTDLDELNRSQGAEINTALANGGK